MRIQDNAELNAYLKRNPQLTVGKITQLTTVPTPEYKPTKYHAKRTEYNGVTFHSKKEAEYAADLDMAKKAGEVHFWLRQVPFDLPDDTRYFLDFMVFYSDRTVHFVECKGFKTREGERKRKWCEKIYGIQVTVV